MSAILLQNGKQAFTDANSRPLAGGKVSFYAPGTNTFRDTWQDSAQTILNTNPVVLDARGEASIYGTGVYRQVLRDASDVLIWDQIIPDLSAAATDAAAYIYARSAVVVTSVADLRAQDSTKAKNAITLSYYVGLNRGGWSYRVDTTDTTSADNGFTVIVGTDGARWKPIINSAPTVDQAGAKGDAVTLDTAAFNAVVTAGYDLVLTEKSRYLIDTVTVSRSIAVQGAGCHDGGSEIIANSASTDTLVFNGPSTSPVATVHGIKFTSRLTKTAGAFVAFKGFGRCRLSNFVMWGAYDGVFVQVSTSVSIQNGLIYSSVHTDINIDSGFTLNVDNVVTDHDAGAQPLAGILISSTGDIIVSNSSFLHAGNCVLMDPPDGKFVTSAWFTNVFFDTSLRGALIRTQGTGQIQRCRFDSCWFGSHTNQGVFIQKQAGGSIEGIHFEDCHVVLNGSDGFRTSSSVKDISIVGGEFCANTGAGVSFGANAVAVSVLDAFIGAYAGLSGNTGSGIYVEAFVENFLLANNQLNGNTGLAITNLNPTATNSIITGNLGYRTTARGVASFATGSTTLVVNHTLPETPGYQELRVTPCSDWGSATKWWISAVTATTFTISTNIAPGVAVVFSWEAKTPSSRT